jgi:hypothetical protein
VLTTLLFIYSHTSRTSIAFAHCYYVRRRRYPPSLRHLQSLISHIHTFLPTCFPIVAISAVTVLCYLPRSSVSPTGC